MTLQEKVLLKGKILEVLKSLKDLFGDKQAEISARLGYANDVFSRVKTDQNYYGSTQLLAAIQIFYQLECLKRALSNETEKQKFFLLAEQFNSDPVDKLAEELVEKQAAKYPVLKKPKP